jgi:hypothetical protein
MKKILTALLSKNECTGIQINGLGHCKRINCKWQGLSACEGINILKTGKNNNGYYVGENGIVQ